MASADVFAQGPQGGVPLCAVCAKKVYPQEMVRSGNKDKFGHEITFHNKCFKCADDTCGTRLRISHFGMEGGRPFCLQHYKEHFGRKGKYDGIAAQPLPHAKPKPTFKSKAGGANLRFGGSPKCPACSKTAYANESVKLNGNSYHITCMKCAECRVKLTLNTAKTDVDTLLCARHWNAAHLEKTSSPVAN